MPLEEEEWYFGDIDRRLAEKKCRNSGDCLVRFSERQKKDVLTCNWNGAAKHFVIQRIIDVRVSMPLIVSDQEYYREWAPL